MDEPRRIPEEQRVEDIAIANAETLLDPAVDPVPCPRCNAFDHRMLPELKRHGQRAVCINSPAIAIEGHQLIECTPVPAAPVNGWITFQLRGMTYPKLCVRCLKTMDQVRVWHYRGKRDVLITLPECDDCAYEGTKHRPLLAGVGCFLGILPGVIWWFLANPHNRESHGVAILAAILLSIVGLFAGVAYSDFRSLPVFLRRFNSTRNTIQMRFKNPGATDPFIKANHAAAVDALALKMRNDLHLANNQNENV